MANSKNLKKNCVCVCLCKCREAGQSGSRNHDACWVFQPLWTKTRDLSAASKRTMSHDVTTNDTLELPTGLPRMVSPHCTQGNDCKGGCRLVAAGRSCFCRQLGPGLLPFAGNLLRLALSRRLRLCIQPYAPRQRSTGTCILG